MLILQFTPFLRFLSALPRVILYYSVTLRKCQALICNCEIVNIEHYGSVVVTPIVWRSPSAVSGAGLPTPPSRPTTSNGIRHILCVPIPFHRVQFLYFLGIASIAYGYPLTLFGILPIPRILAIKRAYPIKCIRYALGRLLWCFGVLPFRQGASGCIFRTSRKISTGKYAPLTSLERSSDHALRHL